MKVVHPAGVRVATQTGAVFRLEPNEPRELPQHLIVLALGHGAHLVEDDEDVVIATGDAPLQMPVQTVEPVIVPTPQVAISDHDRLVAIMKDIIVRGSKDEFRADGEPKSAILNRLFGSPVSEEMRAAAWAEATKVL